MQESVHIKILEQCGNVKRHLTLATRACTFLAFPAAAELQAGDGVCTDKAEFTNRLITSAVPEPPQISKSDAEFMALGVEFVEVREGVKLTELNELFEKVTKDVCYIVVTFNYQALHIQCSHLHHQ